MVYFFCFSITLILLIPADVQGSVSVQASLPCVPLGEPTYKELLEKHLLKLEMVAHAPNLMTLEMEVGG